MKRKALIVYCDNTQSGKLAGARRDAVNLKSFLESSAGGNWYEKEIGFLRNPTASKLKEAANSFMKDADYTFTVFSGHGFINVDDGFRQYVELSDKDVPLHNLVTKAERQTIIIDACRGYYSPHDERLGEEYFGIGDIEHFEKADTRRLFDNAVMKADKGRTILFSSRENESSLDTPSGGAYLFSLLSYAQSWAEQNSKYAYLPLHTAHARSVALMRQKFKTFQRPIMNTENRISYFPLAVKHPLPFANNQKGRLSLMG